MPRDLVSLLRNGGETNNVKNLKNLSNCKVNVFDRSLVKEKTFSISKCNVQCQIIKNMYIMLLTQIRNKRKTTFCVVYICSHTVYKSMNPFPTCSSPHVPLAFPASPGHSLHLPVLSQPKTLQMITTQFQRATLAPTCC